MFIKAKTLAGYKLNSLDGEIGKVNEFYFDDKHWTIRYLIANSGNWLTGRQVLLSPYALKSIDQEEKTIAVNLTKNQIEKSPSLDANKPVSRQFEISYYGYYGWPAYWAGAYMWGYYPSIVRDPEQLKKAASDVKSWNQNLRSTQEVTGYHIQAGDGEIGHIEDFIIDEETWAIRYLIIDTKNWWEGKKVLISPKWIHNISREDSKVIIDVSQKTIKEAPEFTDKSLLSRDYEIELHQHYQRRNYRDEESIVKEKIS